MRRLFRVAGLALLVAVVMFPGSIQLIVQAAAQEAPCFPETGQCISGRFREFWEQNGGLAVFGFPITPVRDELNRDTGKTYPTQWFERARFELHVENRAPYDVLLGRLGDDRLRQLGVVWQQEPKAASNAPMYFAATGHAIAYEPFRRYWQSHGLEFDGKPGVSHAESLAPFGMPLTEPRDETNSSGDRVLTQWFERARFEYHPNNPDPYKVLLGLLGNEVGGARPATLPSDAIWIKGDNRVMAVAPRTPTIALGEPHMPYDVVVAPDGSRLAFIEHSPLQSQDRLIVLDVRNGQRQVFPAAVQSSILIGRFSPDSRTLAYTVIDNADNRWQVRLRDLQNGTVRVLREGTLRDRAMMAIAWTNDGLFAQQILWASDAPPMGLLLINPTNGDVQTVQEDPHIGAFVAPNGRNVALIKGVLSIGEPPTEELSVFDRSTGRTTVLVPQTKTLISYVAWSPDSAKLAFARATDYQRPADPLYVRNADGSGEQSISLGTGGVPGTLKHIAWRNTTTLLLLTADANQQLHLYELPLNTFQPSGLKELGVFGQAGDFSDQIIYVPR